MKDEKSTAKIVTKIWLPILEKFDKKIEMACLRRDAYLARLLRVELAWLDIEVSIPNSEVARQFITERLAMLDCKPVGLTLPIELITRLNDICEVKRIPRDAFFNRIFLLLASSPKAINRLLFQHANTWDWTVEVRKNYEDELHPHSEFYPLSQTSIDPFWAIRAGLNLLNQQDDVELTDYNEPETGKLIKVIKDVPDGYLLPESVYATIFNDKKIKDADLYGLNCYVADQHVPGSATQIASRKTLDELFGNL